MRCTKKEQLWKKAEIKYMEDKLKASLDYDMPEDVHQVANFAEIKLVNEQNKSRKSNNKGQQLLLKRYSGQAKCAVLTSCIMQFLLLLYLAFEVFSKSIIASAHEEEPVYKNVTFGLRIVLVVFTKFLFDAE